MLAAMDSFFGLFSPHQHGIASKQASKVFKTIYHRTSDTKLYIQFDNNNFKVLMKRK